MWCLELVKFLSKNCTSFWVIFQKFPFSLFFKYVFFSVGSQSTNWAPYHTLHPTLIIPPFDRLSTYHSYLRKKHSYLVPIIKAHNCFLFIELFIFHIFLLSLFLNAHCYWIINFDFPYSIHTKFTNFALKTSPFYMAASIILVCMWATKTALSPSFLLGIIFTICLLFAPHKHTPNNAGQKLWQF